MMYGMLMQQLDTLIKIKFAKKDICNCPVITTFKMAEEIIDLCFQLLYSCFHIRMPHRQGNFGHFNVFCVLLKRFFAHQDLFILWQLFCRSKDLCRIKPMVIPESVTKMLSHLLCIQYTPCTFIF